MERQISTLEKITRQYPDNPAGQLYHWHFSRIAHVLRTQRSLYACDLMADKQCRLSLILIPKSYLLLRSLTPRNIGHTSVMLSITNLMGNALYLPKPYWILMTVPFVMQDGCRATRARILHRFVGTLVGLVIASVTLYLHIPEGFTLAAMLLTTPVSYLIIRKNYG